MFIANRLKETNRAEYLLYMWQVEDLLRANGCDIDRLRTNYLSKFDLPDDQRRKMEQWYADLCEMMRSEGVKENGHLQININTLQTLAELHERLVASPKFPFYRAAYYKVLPYIVEIRKRGGHKDEGELQTCFDVLYGVMLLRLQKKPVTSETEAAVKDISALLGQLSDYYFKDREDPIEW